MVKAIQEQQVIIEQLKAKIEALEKNRVQLFKGKPLEAKNSNYP
jgi:hypothetical protein